MNGVLLSPLFFMMAMIIAMFDNSPKLDSLDRAICATGSVVKPECSPVIPDEDGVIRVEILNGRSKTVVCKESGKTVSIEFDAKGYRKVYGNLYSKDKQANIRFSQIVMPDGSADGPFSQDIEYDLPEDGVYKILVGENMMAGDPWGGDMKVQLVFKR